MDSRLLKSACDRSLKSVKQVCSDSGVLYAKSKQAILDAINTYEECIRILKDRIGEKSSDGSINLDSETLNELLRAVSGAKVSKTSTINKEETSSKQKVSSAGLNRNKQEISEFYSVFKQLPTTVENCPEIQKFASLLSDWFTTVFDKRNTNSTGRNKAGSYLRYNRARIHEWVENIVIGYGKARRLGETERYIGDLKSWLNQGTIKYPVPSDIYSFSTKLHDEDVSMEALAIWDLLYEKAFVKFESLDMKHGFSKQNIANRFYDSMSPDCKTIDNYGEVGTIQLLKQLKIFIREESE